MSTADIDRGRTATRPEGPRVGPDSAPPPPPPPSSERRGIIGNGANVSTPVGPAAPESRSLTDLLKELRDEGVNLMRQEMALAKAEMSEKARVYANNGAKAAAGAIVLLLGATYLVGGIITAVYFILAELGMSNVWAGFVSVFGVSLLIALIGWTMISSAKKRMVDESPYPEKTVQSMEENKRWLEQKAH